MGGINFSVSCLFVTWLAFVFIVVPYFRVFTGLSLAILSHSGTFTGFGPPRILRLASCHQVCPLRAWLRKSLTVWSSTYLPTVFVLLPVRLWRVAVILWHLRDKVSVVSAWYHISHPPNMWPFCCDIYCIFHVWRTIGLIFFRKTAECALFDRRRSRDVLKELEAQTVLRETDSFENEWARTCRMDRSILWTR